MSNKISAVNFDNVIQLKFEDFFQNFNEKEKNKIIYKLDIDPNCNDNFDIDYTLKFVKRFQK